ncbi:MAG: KamA family radical SAM protein [Acidobacteriota bacterium]
MLIRPRTYRAYTRKDLDRIPQIGRLPEEIRTDMKAVSAVLPFRVNGYVLDELIDWSRVPDDPMFQLTFPQPGMLAAPDLELMRTLVRRGASPSEIRLAVREIQLRMNPHPAGQRELNVPRDDSGPLSGTQHKYRETVLFFPSQGQTCHAYCTYCFRWAQFVGLEDFKFAAREAERLAAYVRRHPEVESVLFTGGDPLIMRASALAAYIEPLLEIDHVDSIRIGSKAPAYWPYRFVTDPDADELLALFERVRRAGKTLSLMAHYSHPIELSTPIAVGALQRIVETGAVVRTQAPLIRHVNDDADTWAGMWRTQVRLGAVPYYMFVERDTGAREYFAVPLAEAHAIYNDAIRQCSGLERTARGPSMSATPGKVVVQGIAEIGGERVFVLSFLQARDPSWVGRPFFARFDPEAVWLDELEPAFGEPQFFWEPGMRRIERSGRPPWLDGTPTSRAADGRAAG